MSKSLTYAEVQHHSTKKDLYVVIHDKVYNVSSFVDEHPGGEEVLLDVGGQDATEAFEDVGHSDEAREILDGLLVGDLKRGEGEPKPAAASTNKVAAGPGGSGGEGGFGVALYAIIALGGVVAIVAWQYLQNQDKK